MSLGPCLRRHPTAGVSVRNLASSGEKSFAWAPDNAQQTKVILTALNDKVADSGSL